MLSWALPTSHMQMDREPELKNHPARLCETGHSSRWRQGPAGRGGLRRGGAGGVPRTRAVTDRALGRRLSLRAVRSLSPLEGGTGL
jgi:hypothetical protein